MRALHANSIQYLNIILNFTVTWNQNNQYYSVAYMQCIGCDTCSNFKLRILYMTFTQGKTGIVHSKCNNTGSCDRDDKLRIEKIRSVSSRCRAIALFRVLLLTFLFPLSHIITLLTLSICISFEHTLCISNYTQYTFWGTIHNGCLYRLQYRMKIIFFTVYVCQRMSCICDWL